MREDTIFTIVYIVDISNDDFNYESPNCKHYPMLLLSIKDPTELTTLRTH